MPVRVWREAGWEGEGGGGGHARLRADTAGVGGMSGAWVGEGGLLQMGDLIRGHRGRSRITWHKQLSA